MKNLEDHELLEAVKTGDPDSKKVFVEIFIDEVRATFEKLFFPFKCLKAKAKPTIDCRLFGSLTVDVDFLDLIFDEPETSIDIAFQEALASILLPFEETMTTYKDCFHKQIVEGEITPGVITDVLNSIEPVPTHLWVGSDFIGSFLINEELAKASQRGDSESAMSGLFCHLQHAEKGKLTLYTDIFRYDTLRVLDNDEWFVVSENHPRKFWVEWGPVEHKENESSCRVTLLGGMEE